MARNRFTYRGYMRNLRFNRLPQGQGNGKRVEKPVHPHKANVEVKDVSVVE